jgi:hypothetical protein
MYLPNIVKPKVYLENVDLFLYVLSGSSAFLFGESEIRMSNLVSVFTFKGHTKYRQQPSTTVNNRQLPSTGR